MRHTLKNAFWLLLVAAALGLSVNRFSPVGIPLLGQWDESRGVVRANAENQIPTDVFEIDDIEIAKQMYDRGDAIFVDARPAEAYSEGHVDGALSMPAWASEAQVDEFLSMHAPGQPIVVYCSGRTCEDSHRLAAVLVDLGYLDVSIMIDGFPGWQERGFPIAE